MHREKLTFDIKICKTDHAISDDLLAVYYASTNVMKTVTVSCICPTLSQGLLRYISGATDATSGRLIACLDRWQPDTGKRG